MDLKDIEHLSNEIVYPTKPRFRMLKDDLYVYFDLDDIDRMIGGTVQLNDNDR